MGRVPHIATTTAESVSAPSAWPAFRRRGMNVVMVVLDVSSPPDAPKPGRRPEPGRPR